MLHREFPEPMAVSSEVRDGRAWFGGHIPLPINPKPRHDLDDATRRLQAALCGGAYGGDFDQKDAGQGSRVYLPVLIEDALVFFGDPHAAISDVIITGTGIECSKNVRARITLLKDRVLERPIIAQGKAVHFVGVRPECRGSDRGCRAPGRRLHGRTHRPRPRRGLHAAQHHQ